MASAGAAAWRRPLVLGLVAGVVVAIDQATKTWALEELADGPIDLVWTLRLNLSFNSGAAFGVGEGLAPLLIAGAVAIMVVLAGFSRSLTGRLPTLALGMVLGGAAGNLVDRLIRDHDGAVVDFIDLQWWPIFNVADMAIVGGAILLVLTSGRDDAAARATGTQAVRS